MLQPTERVQDRGRRRRERPLVEVGEEVIRACVESTIGPGRRVDRRFDAARNFSRAVGVNCHCPRAMSACAPSTATSATPRRRQSATISLRRGRRPRAATRPWSRSTKTIGCHCAEPFRLFQRLVEPVQNVLVVVPRKGNGHRLLDALRAERRERGRLDAAVGVRGQQDRAVQLRPAPEDDRGRLTVAFSTRAVSAAMRRNRSLL